MKVYQEQWLDRLYKNPYNKQEFIKVCKNIRNDDTGGTDELTQALASGALFFLEDYVDKSTT